jgi:transposase
VRLYEKPYRAVVVHSSAHDRRRQKRLERELRASKQALRRRLSALQQERFACRADAEAAAVRAERERSAYHHLEVQVQECPQYARGRPK